MEYQEGRNMAEISKNEKAGHAENNSGPAKLFAGLLVAIIVETTLLIAPSFDAVERTRRHLIHVFVDCLFEAKLYRSPESGAQHADEGYRTLGEPGDDMSSYYKLAFGGRN
jgi:hypothetical protein